MQQKPIPILMYHSISEMPKGTIMRGLHVPPKRFALQMKLLKLLGYKGLSINELQPYLKGEKAGKVVGLTFDDGYKNNVTNALPILEKNNFSATCYLVSQNVGGINHWDISKGIPKCAMMDNQDTQLWIDAGMEIGSHTQNHIHLTQVDANTAKREIEQSKNDLERQFNCTISNFCYPYGDLNIEIVNMVKNAGYQTATTVQRGRSTILDNKLELPRVPIWHSTLPHLFLLKILTKYEDKR
jgi:peptidoglycan/xylan/chitin deacetylase (PgdA/CDA1 family)